MRNNILLRFITILLLLVGLASCSAPTDILNSDSGNNNSSNNNSSSNEPATAEVSELDTSEMFSVKDLNSSFDADDYTSITGSTDNVETEDSNIEVSQNDITITEAGNYLFTGELVDKSIIVNVDDSEKVYIVLDNLTMTSSSFACIYVISADKVFINSVGVNSLSSSSFVQRDENNVDGVIFSKSDMTIQGEGALSISSSIHGIVGKDDLKLTGGAISINCANHGISANDSVRITNTTVNVASGHDGIKCDNDEATEKGYVYIESGSINVNSGYDGISASSMVQIDDVELDITTLAASSSTVSSKGIKAASNVILTDGEINITSKDDAIHSNGSISIVNPTIEISSDDDGIHADTSLVISGGAIDILKSYEGLEAQNVEINGGAIKVVASDDGINAAGGNDSSATQRPGFGANSFNSSSNAYIKISGGDLYINASGDGVDSNGSLYVSGGYTLVEGPTNSGNGALDYDQTGEISGGVFIATGASGMAMNFSTASQGSILYNTSVASKVEVKVTDASGLEIISFTTTKSCQSLLLSSYNLTQGNSYTIVAGTTSATITLTQNIYSSGGSSLGTMPSRPGR